VPEILSHDPSADTKEILGAAVLGARGDEAIHCVLDVMYSRSLKNSANIESSPPRRSRSVSKNRHRASTFVKGSGSLGNFGSSSS